MSSSTLRSRIFKGKPGGAGAGGGGGAGFNGERPITRETPGIEGFDPDTTTIIQFLEKVFYPAVAPLCSISVDNPVREIGQSPDYTLTWDVTERSNAITGITVDSFAETPTGLSQSGTKTGTLPAASGNYTKSMSATDGTLTGTASCTVAYKTRMFWGTTTKNGGSSPILDSDILALPNSSLPDNFDLALTAFGGGATYLIFAIPSIFGSPSFIIDGLNNTAFTCVRTASAFVNAEGATVVMDVWVSNNLYNSPLDNVILQ